MEAVVYDGSFEDWLCAVFDVYEYKMQDPRIMRQDRLQGQIFGKMHIVRSDVRHSKRVWKGLEKKLSAACLKQLYPAFLSELEGIETTLLHFVQHVFGSPHSVELDYGHPAVCALHQTAKKVARETHRMEAFVRFQKTADNLYYALVEPDYNVLPLLEKHFQNRYADQQWLIFDGRRQYGIYYDLSSVQNVTISFSNDAAGGTHIRDIHDAGEGRYQQLWQQYFKSVNIGVRKNKKLQLQHMPRRYWKYLTEVKH